MDDNNVKINAKPLSEIPQHDIDALARIIIPSLQEQWDKNEEGLYKLREQILLVQAQRLKENNPRDILDDICDWFFNYPNTEQKTESHSKDNSESDDCDDGYRYLDFFVDKTFAIQKDDQTENTDKDSIKVDFDSDEIIEF